MACGVPEESTPAATPEAIRVVFPPALKPWADKVATCAASNPAAALYFIQSLGTTASLGPNVVILELGEPSAQESGSFSSQVGMEQITIITNQNNNLSQLSSDTLQSIFAGQIQTWDGDNGEQIQVWVLPNGDPVRKYFDLSVMHSNPLTSEALLAPDPEAMIEAVSENANAIGYIPKSFLTTINPVLAAKVKGIIVSSSPQGDLNLPVVAVTHGRAFWLDA